MIKITLVEVRHPIKQGERVHRRSTILRRIIVTGAIFNRYGTVTKQDGFNLVERYFSFERGICQKAQPGKYLRLFFYFILKGEFLSCFLALLELMK